MRPNAEACDQSAATGWLDKATKRIPSATDVVPPAVIHQQMPSIPPALATLLSTIHRSGVLDVTIDQQGNVEQAVMREGVHPIFDTLVLDAARSWKYSPAMKGGVAVRYIRTIAIVKQ